MTKEEAWKKYRSKREHEIGCKIILPSWLHEGFTAGYDACLNRTCKWEQVRIDKYSWHYKTECGNEIWPENVLIVERCTFCGGKIEVRDD
jgi:hypothetical protein